MIVLAVATAAVLAGIGLAFFIDWGGPRRVARIVRLRARRAAASPAVGPTLLDDLTGRVKELA